jgi:hypothetical protein
MIWVQQPSPATSCRCQPPSTGRPTPATSGNFSGGLPKKKNHVFFFSCVFYFILFYYYPLLLFSNLNVRHIEFEGDVNVYVGLVPHW